MMTSFRNSPTVSIGNVALSALAFLPMMVLANDARSWLDRMGEAVEFLNYEGRFVRMYDGRDETLHIVHRFQDGEVSERILSLDGPGREIVRHQSEVKCILPDQKQVLVGQNKDVSPLLSALPKLTEGLEPNYSLTMAGSGRVAGRMTRSILIEPRDGYRYGYRLWLDEETAMPLKSELRDRAGNVIERVKFVDIRMSESIPEAALAPVTVVNDQFRTLRPPEDGSRTVKRTTFRATTLPSGFKLSVASVKRLAGSEHPVEHLVYSDGLAAVSVFVEDPKMKDDQLSGASRVGSTNAYSTQLGDRTVTAVGEVPPRTVKSIAKSLQRQTP